MVRAAQYVRMSTEHQKYSTENQAEIIAQYAARRGFEIIKTYEDSGKSGLKLEGRLALQQLIDDVRAGRADFEAVLVYDVSSAAFRMPTKVPITNSSVARAVSPSIIVPSSLRTTAA
ncbi:MAG: recombinase family protein [Sphingomonadaceae bacterium]